MDDKKVTFHPLPVIDRLQLVLTDLRMQAEASEQQIVTGVEVLETIGRFTIAGLPGDKIVLEGLTAAALEAGR